jgi:hypothetical protein
MMEQGFSERAIGIVKRFADEMRVTVLRVKRIDSDKDVGGKGRAMLTFMEKHCKPE